MLILIVYIFPEIKAISFVLVRQSHLLISFRALSTGEQKEGEIVIFTPKDKQPSFPRVMGIVMYPQMLLVPPAGFYVFHKGSQYEDGWQKYSVRLLS